jgi:hypothetical protein
MKIREVEDFIKTRKREQIDASPKVKEKLKERNLDMEHVKDVILNNDICAIID